MQLTNDDISTELNTSLTLPQDEDTEELTEDEKVILEKLKKKENLMKAKDKKIEKSSFGVEFVATNKAIVTE